MTTNNVSKFLQIHTLTSYPAALLNRDDVGFAKRMPFGGVSRTRISSQCLKRHWRRFEGQNSLMHVPGQGDEAVPMSVRSRRTFESLIKDPLVDEGFAEDRARTVAEALINVVLQKSSARAKKDDPDEVLRTGQVVVLGRPEVDYCLKVAREVLEGGETETKAIQTAVKDRFKKEELKNLLTLLDAGLDSAMFGRMVTSDVLSRCDAALHVAHAFTVHGEQAEDDYFSAVDDLLEESGETGSGHINSTELTSGLYYSYVVVDVPLLVSNLTGCKQHQWREAERDLAAEVVRRMVHLVATVSPGAKLGATAPYSYAHMMMIEAGSEAPRTLANAFMKPVQAKNGDLLDTTYSALAAHLQELDVAYGKPGDGRRALALGNPKALDDSVDKLVNLAELSAFAHDQIAQDQVVS